MREEQRSRWEVLELQLRGQLQILYGSFTDPINPLRILYGSLDPSAEAVASAGRQQSYWNIDI
jgi:hypothetical protein